MPASSACFVPPQYSVLDRSNEHLEMRANYLKPVGRDRNLISRISFAFLRRRVSAHVSEQFIAMGEESVALNCDSFRHRNIRLLYD